MLACEYCDFEDLASLVARVLSFTSFSKYSLTFLRNVYVSHMKCCFASLTTPPTLPTRTKPAHWSFYFLPVSQAHNISMNVCEYVSPSLFPHIWLRSFIFVQNVGKSRKNVGYDKTELRYLTRVSNALPASSLMKSNRLAGSQLRPKKYSSNKWRRPMLEPL